MAERGTTLLLEVLDVLGAEGQVPKLRVCGVRRVFARLTIHNIIDIIYNRVLAIFDIVVLLPLKLVLHHAFDFFIAIFWSIPGVFIKLFTILVLYAAQHLLKAFNSWFTFPYLRYFCLLILILIFLLDQESYFGDLK